MKRSTPDALATEGQNSLTLSHSMAKQLFSIISAATLSQNFPSELLKLIEATYLGATHLAPTSYVVSLARGFQIPTEQEISNIQVKGTADGISQNMTYLSFESRQHIVLLEKAVAANTKPLAPLQTKTPTPGL